MTASDPSAPWGPGAADRAQAGRGGACHVPAVPTGSRSPRPTPGGRHTAVPGFIYFCLTPTPAASHKNHTSFLHGAWEPHQEINNDSETKCRARGQGPARLPQQPWDACTNARAGNAGPGSPLCTRPRSPRPSGGPTPITNQEGSQVTSEGLCYAPGLLIINQL